MLTQAADRLLVLYVRILLEFLRMPKDYQGLLGITKGYKGLLGASGGATGAA